MTPDVVFQLAGHDVVATLSGALFVPALATLVVADLHLEKGSSFARRGRLLPPYDSATTLQRLEAVICERRPRRVVCLGDSFHDNDGAQRLSPPCRERLTALVGGRTWIWVAGNHDPGNHDQGAPAGLGGETVPGLRLGDLHFRHEASTDTGGPEVSGHFHPKVTLTARGRRLSARCFVANARRLILPSFGAYTGGLDILSPEILAFMAPCFDVHAIGRAGIHSFRAPPFNGNSSVNDGGAYRRFEPPRGR